MLTSEYAALNPTVIAEGVDNAIKACWESMHKYRKRSYSRFDPARSWDGHMAERYKHTLRYLIQIRRGEWQ